MQEGTKAAPDQSGQDETSTLRAAVVVAPAVVRVLVVAGGLVLVAVVVAVGWVWMASSPETQTRVRSHRGSDRAALRAFLIHFIFSGLGGGRGCSPSTATLKHTHTRRSPQVGHAPLSPAHGQGTGVAARTGAVLCFAKPGQYAVPNRDWKALWVYAASAPLPLRGWSAGQLAISPPVFPL